MILRRPLFILIALAGVVIAMGPLPNCAGESAPTVLPLLKVTGSADSPGMSPSTGTRRVTLEQSNIQTFAQGSDTSFNQVLTRLPGIASDTYGAVHFRNEDPYYRYYINGTLLPVGVNGFSQDLDTRCLESVTFVGGALPAYYNEGSYGVVDVRTKTGNSLNGGTLSFYGGSNQLTHPSFTYGASSGPNEFLFTGSYLQNDQGLENPTSTASAVHDQTQQFKGFLDFSHEFTDAGKLSLILSGADSSYELPNIAGQPPADFSEVLASPTPAPVDSSSLDERQHEGNYYGILAYQQSNDGFSYQLSQVNRWAKVLFNPDVNGDLSFNQVAARVQQGIETHGVQADFSSELNETHTLRWGLLGETSRAVANNTVYTYGLASDGGPTDPYLITEDDHSIQAYDYAVYVQDAWKIAEPLTLNFGGRFEQVKAYTDESQFSPRINAVYEIDPQTSLHGGYARYFIAPPLESIAPASVQSFNGTTNAADQTTDDPVKAERDHYFDFGIMRTILPNLTMGLDTYYKMARNQIDDGQFGAANIRAPYNYGSATTYGAELSAQYRQEGFSAYGNFAASDSWATNIVSSQFEFGSDELDYIAHHQIRPDQTQFFTASLGVSYTWIDTTFHLDGLYGDGLRDGFANTGKLQPYYPVNLGVQQRLRGVGPGNLVIRFDIINLTDQIYVLNDGTGIGEGAIKYGPRRGFFSGLTYEF